MAEPTKEVPAKTKGNGEGQLESVRSDNFIKLYANSARVETSIWDMKIFFGELVLGGGPKPFIEESACISMSPQHAKAMLGVLSTNINEYENRFGKIPSPPAEPTAEPAKKI